MDPPKDPLYFRNARPFQRPAQRFPTESIDKPGRSVIRTTECPGSRSQDGVAPAVTLRPAEQFPAVRSAIAGHPEMFPLWQIRVFASPSAPCSKFRWLTTMTLGENK